MKKVLITACVLGAIVATAGADTIAYWNFENSTAGTGGNSGPIASFGTVAAPTDYASDAGVGTARLSVWGAGLAGNLSGTNGGASSPTGQFGTFQGVVEGTTTGAGGALSPIGQGNNGHYFLIIFNDAIDAAQLTFDTRGTATGFSTQTFDYSVDGGANWTNSATLTGRNVTTYSSQLVNFGGVFAASSGDSKNVIRITVSGATSDSGNNRFDNLRLSGTIVPEPATLILLGLGGLFLRRRSA